MRRSETLSPVFVDEIPSALGARDLYVSMRYGTAVHLCCCGCGNEVVTPFSPTDWKLTFDGESVSLHPSIGNWSFACESHYWIVRNEIRWAESWSTERIAAGRAFDAAQKSRDGMEVPDELEDASNEASGVSSRPGFWHTVLRAIRSVLS